MQIMYYIGLDKKTISYCVKDGGGGTHAVGKIPAKRLGAARRDCHLDTSRKRCNMTYRDSNPADSCSTEDRKRTSRRRPNMNAKILTFSSHGDTTLLEYDPETADMEEINRVIAEYEAKTGAQPFDMATGERVQKVTREQNEVLMVPPIAGG
jgi:hypothetical protein